MRITIEPETDQEKEHCQIVVYEKVCEFALAGTFLEADILPRPMNHTHGDTYVLVGKIEELKERLRVKHANS